jgi:hypothetical protein
MSPLIFLSYRHLDQPNITKELHAYLTKAYGPGAVFLDIENISLGAQIQSDIIDCINQCSVMLPIIGVQWLQVMNGLKSAGSNGKQRKDWVRIELEEALANPNIRIVPLLLNSVPMPQEEDLPESIKLLSGCKGMPIRAEALHEDLPMLVRRLDTLIEGSSLELPSTLPSPTDSKQLREAHYRHEVRYCLESNDGRLDDISHIYLDALSQHLRLPSEVTRRIQDNAQQPYQRYTTTVQHLIDQQLNGTDSPEATNIASLNQRSINHLRRLHHHLAVPRWKAKKIEAQLLKDWKESRAALSSQSGWPPQQSPSAGDR